MHFTHIGRRILKIKPSVGNVNLDNDDDGKPITLIVDASGLTITKKGDYIEQKWIRKKKRVYLTITSYFQTISKGGVPAATAI